MFESWYFQNMSEQLSTPDYNLHKISILTIKLSIRFLSFNQSSTQRGDTVLVYPLVCSYTVTKFRKLRPGLEFES